MMVRIWANVLKLLVVLAFSETLAITHAYSQGGCPAPIGGEGLPPCIRPISPQIGCINPNPNGTYTVQWGYISENNTCCPAYELPIRATGVSGDPRANFFTPAPIDRGQPSQFLPGNNPNAFSTTWDGTPLTWTLRYFTLTPPFFADASIVADSSNQDLICPNNPPICNAGGPYNVTCGGTQTTVNLDGTQSSDPDQFPLTYVWSVTCDQGSATLQGETTATPTLTLTGPGLGQATNCVATLTVGDGRDTRSCIAPVTSPACQLDCLNQPNGGATLDLCGVCNGNNACVDCAGVPNGGAVADRCGVCNGDGNSCLGCAQSDIFTLQIALDSNAAAQRNLVNTASFRFEKARGFSASAKRYGKRVRGLAEEAYNRSWISSWQLPRITTQCTNAQFCVNASTAGVVETYRVNTDQLRQIAIDVSKRLRKVAGNANQVRQSRTIAKKAAKLFAQSQAAAQSVPAVQSTCS